MDEDAYEFWISNDVPPRVFAYLMDKCVDIGMSSHNALLAGLSHLSGAYAGTLNPARIEQCLQELNLESKFSFQSSLDFMVQRGRCEEAAQCLTIYFACREDDRCI